MRIMNYIQNEDFGQLSSEKVTDDHINELIDAKLAEITNAEEVAF